MTAPPPPPGGTKYPVPQLEKHNANHYHSDVMDRIALLTVHQRMAGMLVPPKSVKLVERHVSHRYLRGYEPIEFRFTFHVVTNEKSRPKATWLVTIATDDVLRPNGQVVESTPMRNAKVYEWDDSKGWELALEYEHQTSEEKSESAPFDHSDPFNFPPLA